jgi:hypothetical protein
MKKKGQTRAAAFLPADLLRRLVLLCLVLAVSAQAYLVQTHIHGQPSGAGVHSTVPATPTPGYPVDPATCQLCKEMLHASVAITPVAPVTIVLLQWIAMAQAVTSLPATPATLAVGWQGRAPPRR